MNVHEAKTNFSRLLVEVEGGREVIITRAGVPVARLVPYEGPTTLRTPGGWEGRVTIADDFDDLPDEVLSGFEGGAS